MNSLINLIVFIFSPLLGFVISLMNRKDKLSDFIFLAFFFLIGCSFSFHDMEVDSYRYAVDFAQLRECDSDFILLERLFQGKIDFYDYFICDIVSRFTESARLLYAVYAVVFGFFVLKFYHFINEDWGEKRKDTYVWIIILVIFFLNPHININGVRYFTATWIFFTSFIAYFVYDKKMWILGLVLVPIVHISFLIPLSFILVSCIFRKYFGFKQLYFVVIISFIVGLLLPVDRILSMLPTDFGLFSHFEAYTDSDYVSTNHSLKDSRSLLYIFFSKLPFVYVCVFLFILKKKNIILEKENWFLLIFVMLILSFLFVLDKIPSMGRFYFLTYTLLLYLTFRIYKESKISTIMKLIKCIPILFFGMMYNNIVNHGLVLSNIYFYKPIWEIIEFALSYKLR